MDLDFKTYNLLYRKLPKETGRQEWFKVSYPTFVSHTDKVTKDNMILTIAHAYSWMPTIPKFKPWANDDWSKIEKYLNELKESNSSNLSELLKLLIPVINQSIVGTSKVLHYYAPEFIPILDRRVIRTWNLIFSHNPKFKLDSNLSWTGREKWVVENYIKYQELILKWKSYCDDAVSIRDIEHVLYAQNVSEKEIKAWWEEMSLEFKYIRLQSIPDPEQFAEDSVNEYVKERSLTDVFYELQEDEAGAELLRKHAKMTDSMMDVSYIHQADHYWNTEYQIMLQEIFLTNKKWFNKMHTVSVSPPMEDLVLLYFSH